MEDASGAHASTSRLDSVEPMPVTDLGGKSDYPPDVLLDEIFEDLGNMPVDFVGLLQF